MILSEEINSLITDDNVNNLYALDVWAKQYRTVGFEKTTSTVSGAFHDRTLNVKRILVLVSQIELDKWLPNTLLASLHFIARTVFRTPALQRIIILREYHCHEVLFSLAVLPAGGLGPSPLFVCCCLCCWPGGCMQKILWTHCTDSVVGIESPFFVKNSTSRFELWWNSGRPTWSLACEENMF